MKTYAAYYDNPIRKESSSGGLFSILASYFDVTYGVEMSADNTIALYARKTDDISSLRGSKYIQAKPGDSYKNARDDLEMGKKVLFTGTACQINGLYSFLKKEYPNLLTVDVICHGVPTPLYWQKFIEGKNISYINFRAKDGGWDNYTYGMRLNEKYIPYNENKFMSLYVRDYPLRPSCYECVCKQQKKSDITLGDFWGIEKIDPKMTDNKGTSVVFIRSEKGQKVFELLQDSLICKEMSYEEGVRQNPSEYESSKRPDKREKFFEDMQSMTFDELYAIYGSVPKMSFASKCIRKAKRLFSKAVGRN